MQSIESIDHKGYTIDVYPDDCVDSPREWDNLGTMATRHRDYKIGEVELPQSYYSDKLGDTLYIDSYEGIVEYLTDNYGELAIVKPLYLLDHSGLWLSTGRFVSDAQGWDTSYIGVIFITKEKVKKEYSVKRITKTLLNKIDSYLTSEVKTMSQYLSGDVRGYIVKNQEGEQIDSCWGYYEDKDAIDEGKSYVDWDIMRQAELKAKKLKTYIKNNVPFEYRFS